MHIEYLCMVHMAPIIVDRHVQITDLFFFGLAGEMRLRMPRPEGRDGGMWDSPYLTDPTH